MRKTTIMGWRRLAIAALVATAATPGPDIAAQVTTQDAGEMKVGCFRGRPLPRCKSFWLIEMQGSQPLVQTERTLHYQGGYSVRQGAFDHVLEWNLGHMMNVAGGMALGGVVTIGTGSDGPFTGFKARARRWLSSDVSVEVEGGLMRTHAQNTQYPSVTGPTADVRLNIRDHGSFYVRWDGVRIDPELLGDLVVDPGGFQQAISVGVGLGSWPALAGSGALGLGYVILLGMLIGTLE